MRRFSCSANMFEMKCEVCSHSNLTPRYTESHPVMRVFLMVRCRMTCLMHFKRNMLITNTIEPAIHDSTTIVALQ